MTKKEKVDKLYNKFKTYKNTAEQNELPIIYQLDIFITKAYNNLQKNWNDKHADIFIKGIEKQLKEYLE